MEIGMGWLGWTEQQTLDTTIPAIELAYSGRLDFLRAMHGMPPAGDTPPQPATLPAVNVFSAFRIAAKQ